jgi:hypothetical protein
LAVEFLGLAHLDRSLFFTGRSVSLSACCTCLPKHFDLSPSIGINRAQANIFDGEFDGQLRPAESFRHRNNGLEAPETIEWE